jgi:hypothetical protein
MILPGRLGVYSYCKDLTWSFDKNIIDKNVIGQINFLRTVFANCASRYVKAVTIRSHTALQR